MSQPDFCSQLDLSAFQAGICKQAQEVAYKAWDRIDPNLPLLTHGIEDTIRRNATRVFIYETIMQQLPWIISFIMLIIILWMFGILPTFAVFVILILSILATVIIIVIYMNQIKSNTEKLINELREQWNYNVNNFSNAVLN